MRLAEPQSKSESFGEEIIFSLIPGFETQIMNAAHHSEC
jgi:hypothetical protein